MENYYKTLPEGYREAFVVDAKNRKTSIVMTIASFVLTIGFIIPFFFTSDFTFVRDSREKTVGPLLVLAIGLFTYLIMHELIHGAAYKTMTHQKLRFGLTLSVAYCGVPDVYVSRRTAMIALLAPFVVFDVVFLALVIYFRLSGNAFRYFLSGVMLSFHVGGCIGDLYDTCLLLFKFKDSRTLMIDTGPKQTFYVPE